MLIIVSVYVKKVSVRIEKLVGEKNMILIECFMFGSLFMVIGDFVDEFSVAISWLSCINVVLEFWQSYLLANALMHHWLINQLLLIPLRLLLIKLYPLLLLHCPPTQDSGSISWWLLTALRDRHRIDRTFLMLNSSDFL